MSITATVFSQVSIAVLYVKIRILTSHFSLLKMNRNLCKNLFYEIVTEASPNESWTVLGSCVMLRMTRKLRKYC